MHVRTLSSLLSSGFSFNLSLLSFSLSLFSLIILYLFSCLSLCSSLSISLFISFISSSFLFACSVLCCAVLCCVVVCCCMWLCFVCACLCVLLNSVFMWREQMEDSTTFCSRPVLKLKTVDIHGFLCLTSGASDNPTWANFGKQNWRWHPPPSSHRVYVQSAPMCTGTNTHMCVDMWTCCWYTRERCGCTHWVFQRVNPHTTPHHTVHTPQPTTTDSHTQQRQPHTTNQPTNLQLHSTQHGKNHQVQTQKGLTDRSFLIYLIVLHCRFPQLWKWFVRLIPFTTETSACRIMSSMIFTWVLLRETVPRTLP